MDKKPIVKDSDALIEIHIGLDPDFRNLVDDQHHRDNDNGFSAHQRCLASVLVELCLDAQCSVRNELQSLLANELTRRAANSVSLVLNSP